LCFFTIFSEKELIREEVKKKSSTEQNMLEEEINTRLRIWHTYFR
jgi:hypothetical protein